MRNEFKPLIGGMIVLLSLTIAIVFISWATN
jgi:hypothetical protein